MKLDDKLIFEAYSRKDGDPRIKKGSLVKIQMLSRSRNPTYPIHHDLNGKLAIITHINKDSYSFKLLHGQEYNRFLTVEKDCVEYISDPLKDENNTQGLLDILDI